MPKLPIEYSTDQRGEYADTMEYPYRQQERFQDTEAWILNTVRAVSETSHFLLFLRTMALVVGFLRPVFFAVL